MKLFSMDSPLMIALNKMADLLWVNVLAVVCCIPIVTVGASMTALHYMALKIARNEETYVTKSFFKSFKDNFKQGTIIWLIQIVAFAVLIGDYYILFFSGIDSNVVMRIFLYVVTVIVLLTTIFVYPVLAKFDNSTPKTIKNAFFVGMLQVPKAIIMWILFLIPVVLIFAAPQIFPLIMLFGLSVPAFISAKMYDKFFGKLEEKVQEANPDETADAADEDEHIFNDELDPALAARDDIE